MDLQLAHPTSKEGSMIARIGVLLFFGLACGLLVASLSGQTGLMDAGAAPYSATLK